MENLELHRRLIGLDRPLGTEARSLDLGCRSIRIEGLDAELAGRLEHRWGGFLSHPVDGAAGLGLRVFLGGAEGWLERWKPGDAYRLEALNDAKHRVVASYHFALCAEATPDRWRVGVTDEPDEPLERILDNAVRYLTAEVAAGQGGFALHAAGVLREGRAYLFAGPSGAGKSTAARLVEPDESLGDDFGMLLPGDDGWVAPALPFDNSERILHAPPRGLFPVAGVWRLEKSTENRVERLPASLAVASLIGCAAFPWAMPELADRLLQQARRFVAEGRFRRLHFADRSGLWSDLSA